MARLRPPKPETETEAPNKGVATPLPDEPAAPRDPGVATNGGGPPILATITKAITYLLDRLPVATVQAYAGIVVVLYAYFTGSISFIEAGAFLGLNGVGAAAVGKVRNESGRGVKQPRP
jgi:hypothetical protein